MGFNFALPAGLILIEKRTDPLIEVARAVNGPHDLAIALDEFIHVHIGNKIYSAVGIRSRDT